MKLRILLAAFLALPALALAAPSAHAATFSRNAWIPYWNADGGIGEAEDLLDGLTSVSPFSFSVDSSGRKVKDLLGLKSDREWKAFLKKADREGVAIYPTVAWSDGAAMEDVLSDSRDRKKHIDAIVKAVITANRSADGLEIDYEGKLAETKDDFSAFLSELGSKLHAKDKKLICDIEARTPLVDRFGAGAAIPATATMYANDYKAIGKACDEVRIMAYDQGLADVTLVRSGARPYAPVSDTAWVKKAITLAMADMPASKIVMGIPTYGRVWRIDPRTGGYTMISSITYEDAIALAKKQNVTPVRGRSGELQFTYTGLTSGLPGTATPTGVVNTYYVTVSDATAIASHVALAKQLGIGGVALFKLDGTTDPKAGDAFLK